MAFDQDKACELIASGQTLTQVVASFGLQSPSAVTDLAREDEHFAAKYARALDQRTETFVEQIMPIADNDEIAPDDKRVRIDARKWIAAKLKPKKYGDRIQSDIDLAVTVTVVNPFQVAQDAVQAALASPLAIEPSK